MLICPASCATTAARRQSNELTRPDDHVGPTPDQRWTAHTPIERTQRAALFAALHFNMVQFAPLFVLGVALAYLYERTRNLAGPIVVHALHNSVTLAFLLMSRQGG